MASEVPHAASPRAVARYFDGAGAFVSPEKLLCDLSAEQALAPVAGAPHSIAAIIAHLHYWQDFVLQAATGGRPQVPASAAGGWPAVSHEGWRDLRQAFLDGVARCQALAREAGRLESTMFWGEREMTVGYALVDTALHNAHHLGQIVTLRQMLGAWPPEGGGVTW